MHQAYKKIDRYIEVYEACSGVIGKELPSYSQWKYLEELHDNEGLFGGRRFSRTLYNRLGSTGECSLELYKRFYQLRDSMPEMKKLKLPSEFELADTVEKLEAVSNSRSHNTDLDARIRGRKAYLDLEYADDKFRVVVPGSSYEIMLEAINQDNCLMDYLEKHANGETTIVFLRQTAVLDESYVTMEIDTDHCIRQVYGTCNSTPDRAVFEFLERYARKKWLYYNPCELIEGIMELNDYEDCDDNVMSYIEEFAKRTGTGEGRHDMAPKDPDNAFEQLTLESLYPELFLEPNG
ncbi:PcfJ domain-containing protein [Eisenbergiella porci]|jgi:NAD-dependent dihydropyrimidine dehydrogenase PreA subunit|uniref:PcfJ domain-containing protein n=1 Tax=Eisenbergiella porci TaxID=2652274 RepID=UPI002A810994|nr:PcfJ domain-containing protein [Eisenbergiella porci]